MEMFKPIFVYDSKHPSPAVELARAKKFRMIDVREPNTSAHGGNPVVVVYDQNSTFGIDEVGGRGRYLPPKNTGVMVIHNFAKGKGHVRALPERQEFVEWFFGGKVCFFNWSTGNFRVELDGTAPKKQPLHTRIKEWLYGITIQTK